MNYDSYKEWAICACNGIIDDCNRMTSGNYMHNINAVKMTAKMIRDNCLPHLFETPQSPWISVEDRLPELNKYGESEMVFVRVINKDTKAEWIEQPAKYNINIKDWIAMDFTHISKRNGMVTHWMPIPKLQEE